jgi:signal transduction histidine kinase
VDAGLDVLKPSTLFLVATVFGISSAFQAYWADLTAPVTHDPGQSHSIFQLLVLNLIYWYVPALVAPFIMRLSLRYRAASIGWPLVVLLHVAGVGVYSVGHTGVMILARMVVAPIDRSAVGFGSWWRYAEHEYFMQLDWLQMTYLFLVGLAYALAYWRESETRALNAAQLETRVVRAQLRALQNELRPHFLFNTLNTISGLMRTDLAAADITMDRLADLLRMTLNTSDMHALHQELAIIGKYLDIEQTRFRDRLTIVMDIAPDVLDALVPSLVLQPLVENAVRHGVAPHARPGSIQVQAAREGPHLTIHVRDSGDGAPPGQLVALNRGIGLGNTRARLAHLYSGAYRFEFSNVDGGFCVTVSIPYQVGEEAEHCRMGAA